MAEGAARGTHEENRYLQMEGSVIRMSFFIALLSTVTVVKKGDGAVAAEHSGSNDVELVRVAPLAVSRSASLSSP